GLEIVGVEFEGLAEGCFPSFYIAGLISGGSGAGVDAGEFGIETEGFVEVAAGGFELVEVQESGASEEVGSGAVACFGDFFDSGNAVAALADLDQRRSIYIFEIQILGVGGLQRLQQLDGSGGVS